MNTFVESAWTSFHLMITLDPVLWGIAARSLGVSSAACLLGCGFGITLGAYLGVARFAFRPVVLAFLNTFLALPSVLVGLVVYLLLSRTGPLGFLGWLFSFKAMVLAQMVLVVPVAAALSRQVVEDVDVAYGEQWRSLGANHLTRCLLLAWNERMALLTVVVVCFGRAISEVGAVMIVGGNIDGFTRVMTTAIALETSKGDLPLALALGLVLLAIVGCLNGVLALLQYLQDRHQQSKPSTLRGWVV
jgi:tungstate transport system permease protein